MSGILLAASIVGPRVTLSGEAGIDDEQSQPTDSYAGVRINSDGTIDKRLGGAYSQIDAATDWILPNGADKSAYSVRCTDNNANLDAGSSATGSWLALTSNREWYVSVTGFSGTKNLDIDLEISNDGGTTILATGNYTGQAVVTP